MKRIIVSGILLALFLYGCGNDDINKERSVEELEEIAEDPVKEASLMLKTDGKETFAIDLLEAEALYKFEGKDGEEEYLVYFYAENEEETPLEANSFLGNAGDLMRSGDYYFYVATKGDDVAYKQEQLDALPLSFNKETVNNSTIHMGDYTLISVASHEGINLHNVYLYSLNEGELIQIDSSELGAVYTTKIKALGDDKLQAVSYLNQVGEDDFGWHFRTFEINRTSFTLTEVADAVYNESNWGLEAGHDRFQLWMEDEESFVPFRAINDLEKIEITKETLVLAASNELGDIPVKLGDDMADLMKQNKEMEAKVWFGGSEAVRFLGYVVYYNAVDFDPMNYSGEIVLLALPPERIQMTVDEVIDVLGEPLSHDYDEYSQEYSAVYNAGDNVLKFTYMNEGDLVAVELRY